ncbi:putative membrane bound peptidase; NefD homolog [Cupriavidus taiwanensis]|uniref:Membrane bound peptidase NefD homolog n=1 Tax=Cupriavidus taiwanensis TaxID=164546 RepID=A0A375E106_9BURK|nr:nodulation protein NfeD [Cupriavidus taiwanensis]SOZ54769.1 putative membrane bound peptidase; NefD homolog [Cupriavidus taiwanensis]SOZ55778.1 putative membrane bound peptidase; NefD homolog [Cupriavidus taiwanensis]SOZ58120.1 putative membrane bound peptidase; NefD homolog [Cupriavidus taiwanensis]SOZ98359.1 putative membrane bound peptidase; NefD homolog [Cupriavidus taiwanensis]SPA05228.1 putative membrane bound peptidase; NefD homolog [Cupriavidus taiwanensis]
MNPATALLRAFRLLSSLALACCALAFGGSGAAAPPAATATATAPVYVIPLKGAVSPASASFILRGMARAREAGAQLVVLEMDTPGGLDASMRDIIQAILASPVPVASYVSPGGARAASAGTYILYASHIAAMAPGTNLGAATPVQVGIGGPQKPDALPGASPASAPASAPANSPTSGDTMARKQMHDASAYIRGLAQLRGRNAEWAERAVRESVSLSADEALAQRVIDVVAADLPALLRQLDGRKLTTAGGKDSTLQTRNAPSVTLEPDWRNRFLAVITEPSVALLLMMIGIYALIFEFSTPGMVVPGIVGAICLLLALFALHMLPVNYAGLALVALGIGCMVAELFLPTFGALGVGGIIAFAFGAVMLIDTDVPGFGVPLPMVAAMSALSAVFVFGMSAMLMRSRKRPVVSGADTLVGSRGELLDDLREEGWASVRGETWRVRSATPLARGTPVLVTGRSGLVLEVIAAGSAPASSSQPTPDKGA